MTAEQNKAVVRRYLDHFEKGETEAALELLSDDLVWWIIGKPHLYPYGGIKTKAEIAEIFDTLATLIDGWVTVKIIRMVAEDGCVAVEWEGQGRAKTGKPYHNNFSFFFVIRDQKIVEVREYFDLMHVIDAFTPVQME